MSRTLDEAKPRIPSQQTKILQALREAGEAGLTNKQLQQISIRWVARMSEIYEKGYVIENFSLGKGLYKYVLVREPNIVQTKSDKAVEILLAEIDKHGKVTSDELRELLDRKRMVVHRRSGSHKRT